MQFRRLPSLPQAERKRGRRGKKRREKERQGREWQREAAGHGSERHRRCRLEPAPDDYLALFTKAPRGRRGEKRRRGEGKEKE